jgi:hypothetical protein
MTMHLNSHFRKAQRYTLAVVCMLVAQVSADGQTNGPEIEVTDAYGSPLVSGQGSVELAAAAGVARPLVITVRNTGSAVLSNVTASLSALDEFVISYELPQTIAPGQEGQLTVTMLPVSAQPTAVLTITSNDADEPSFLINLSGHLHSGGPLLVVKRRGSYEIPLRGADYVSAPGSNTGVASAGDWLQLFNYGDEDLVGLAAEMTVTTGVPPPIFHGPTTLVMEGRTELQLPSTLGVGPEMLRLYTTLDARPKMYHIAMATQPTFIIGGPGFGGPGILGPITTSPPIIGPRPILVIPVNPHMPYSIFVELRLGELDSGAATGSSVVNTDLRGWSDTGSLLSVSSPATIQGAPDYISASGPAAVGATGSTLAMRFNGSSKVTKGLVLSGSAAWSMEAWVRPLLNAGTQCILYMGTAGVDGSGIYQVDGTLRGRLGGVGDVGSFTFAPGEWVHVALVNKDGTTTFYVDGAAAGTSSTELPIAASGGPITVGATPAGTDFFTGDVDEVRLGSIKANFDPSLHLLSAVYSQRLSLTKGGGLVPGTLYLNALQLGSSSMTDFSLINRGPMALSGVTVAIEGPDAADFTIQGSASLPLNAFSASAFSVKFSPSRAGIRTATLRIAYPGLPGQDIVVELSSAGVSPPDIEVDNYPSGTSTLRFTQPTVGGGSIETTKKITIRNTGTGELNGLAASVRGSDVDRFQISNLVTALAPGASAEVTLTYTSSDRYSKNAVLEIRSNDLDENPYTITLSGPGAGFLVVEQPLKGRLEQHADVINFTRKSATYFPMRNDGQSYLTGVSASIVGAHASDFNITGMPRDYIRHQWTFYFQPQLAASSFSGSILTNWNPNFDLSTALGVAFSPSGPGVRHARLLITSSDPLQSPFEVELVGRANLWQPEIEVTDALSLWDQVSGSSTASLTGSFDSAGSPIFGKRFFVVRNRGYAALTGLKASLTQTGTSFGARWLGSEVLLPGEGGLLEVSFDPSLNGTTGTVNLHSSDPDESPFLLKVEGYIRRISNLGVRPIGGSFVAREAVVSCPPAAVGKMSQLKLEVVNLGTTTLDPSGVDGYTEEFSISPTAIPKLAPGAKTLLTVSFRPKGVGIRASLNAFIFGAESHSFHVTGIGVESPDYLDVLEPGEVVAMGGSFSVGPAPRPNAPPVGFINGMVDSQQKYQWLRNGKPIRGATEATLSVSDAKISDGGQYDVIVSNEAGRHRVSITFVMVVDQTIRTRDRVVRVGQKATVSALTSLGRDANIEWKVDEPQTWLPYSPHVSLSFANTGRHAISATISSVMTSSSITTDTLFIDVVSDAPTVVTPAPQSWMANDPVSLQIETTGVATRFGISGHPPGVTISPAGLIAGRPSRAGQYNVKLWAMNPAGKSEVVSVSISVMAVDRALVGRFAGVFAMHPELNGQLGGCFKLDTTAAATYTGSVQQGGRTWKLSGRFDDVSNVNGMTFERWLLLDDVSNAIRLRVKIGPDSQATVSWKAGDHEMEATGVKRAAPPRFTPGRYNLLTTVSALQRDIDTETPTTHGFISAVLDASGNVTFTGRMGDGEAVSGSSLWGADTTVPIHRLFYNAEGGAVSGHARLEVPVSGGRLHWVKKPSADSELFPGGWNPLALDLSGGRYTPPTLAQLVDMVQGPSLLRPQMHIELTGDGLPPGVISQLKPSLFGLTVQSASSSSISKLTLGFSWRSGSLFGDVTLKTGHRGRLHALHIPSSNQTVGLCRVIQPDGTFTLASVVVYTDPPI